MGTWLTLVNNLGFTHEEAKTIEANYHKLYEVSNLVSQEIIAKAAYTGYVPLAFGLKLRTPLLKRTVMNGRLPSNVAAEGRTANNAYSQSYGLLMNRAIIDVQSRLDGSGFEDYILPMNTIHDAVYYLVRDTPEAVKWLNDNLIDAMEWNDDPRIKSDVIPMTAELDVGKSWAKTKTLKNKASLEEVSQFLETIE